MTLLLASFAPPYWLSTLIKVLVISAVVPTTALILGMVFLFKIMSWMQSRLGPQEAGPRGTLQLLADGVKFLQKEDIAPNGADRWVFKVAPLVVLMSTLLLYVALPASMHLVVADLDVGIFFVLAVSSLSVIGVLMAGWSSANKYSLMGALRAAECRARAGARQGHRHDALHLSRRGAPSAGGAHRRRLRQAGQG